jgi:type IV pilus assembly protein PilY1
VQSFYGVWDKPSAGRITYSSRTGTLREVEILSESTSSGTRITTAAPSSSIYAGSTPKRGWFMDLKVKDGTAKGERVFSAPRLIDDRVVFVSVEPSTDACEAGGNSWIMELSALDGSRPNRSVFDLNNDNKFTSADEVTLTSGGTAPPSAVRQTGVLPGLTLIGGGASSDTPPTQMQFKMSNSSVDGNIVAIKNRGRGAPRGSWREIQ